MYLLYTAETLQFSYLFGGVEQNELVRGNSTGNLHDAARGGTALNTIALISHVLRVIIIHRMQSAYDSSITNYRTCAVNCSINVTVETYIFYDLSITKVSEKIILMILE